jgi:hypothetical protein
MKIKPVTSDPDVAAEFGAMKHLCEFEEAKAPVGRARSLSNWLRQFGTE